METDPAFKTLLAQINLRDEILGKSAEPTIPQLTKGVYFDEALGILNEWLYKVHLVLKCYDNGHWYVDDLSNGHVLANHPTFAQAYAAALELAEHRMRSV